MEGRAAPLSGDASPVRRVPLPGNPGSPQKTQQPALDQFGGYVCAHVQVSVCVRMHVWLCCLNACMCMRVYVLPGVHTVAACISVCACTHSCTCLLLCVSMCARVPVSLCTRVHGCVLRVCLHMCAHVHVCRSVAGAGWAEPGMRGHGCLGCQARLLSRSNPGSPCGEALPGGVTPPPRLQGLQCCAQLHRG